MFEGTRRMPVLSLLLVIVLAAVPAASMARPIGDAAEPTPQDTDGDGYSNADETLAGSSPTDPSSTPADRDGDGWSNREEDCNNNGVVDAGETDADDDVDHPHATVKLAATPAEAYQDTSISFTATTTPPVTCPGRPSAVAGIAWTFGDGGTATGESATHAYGDSGRYTVTVTVTDDHGGTTVEELDLTILNRLPVALFGFTPETAVATDTTVQFDARTSSDDDGIISAYAWSFGDGAAATGATAAHRYLQNGVFNACLNVTDDKGGRSNRCALIPVANLAPAVDFAFEVPAPDAAPAATRPVNFTGTASDADGTVVAWAWDFGDGATSAEEEPVHAYALPGEYEVSLTVTDDDGKTTRVAHPIRVLHVPNASFLVNPVQPTDVEDVLFTDASDTGNPGGVVAWAWEFGDGATSAEQSPTHRYAANGEYAVNLTVTDASGIVSATLRRVLAVANVAPVSDFKHASAVPTLAQKPAATRLVRFTQNASDVDGTVVQYRWDFGGGASAEGAMVYHTFATAGDHVVKLMVTDDDGKTTTAEKTITILPLPVANFTFDIVKPTDLENVTFTDLSVGEGIWAWDWGFSPGNSTLQNPQHRFANDGLYAVSLRVKDAHNITSDPRTVHVTVTNVAPNVRFTVPAGQLLTSRAIQFTDTSADPDGTVVVWTWTFGDGEGATTQHPTHRYASDPRVDERTYLVRLQVRDNDGWTSSFHEQEVVVLQDTDGDGVPDKVDADDDGDGATDEAEVEAGSNPRDARSTITDFDGDRVPNVVELTLGRQVGPRGAEHDPCAPNPLSPACAGSPVPAPADLDADGVPDTLERDVCTKPSLVAVVEALGGGCRDEDLLAPGALP